MIPGSHESSVKTSDICNRPNFMSPSAVLPLHKAEKSCKRCKGSTKILNDIHVRETIAAALKQKTTKNTYTKARKTIIIATR